MRSTMRVRVARVLGGGALIAALLLPAGDARRGAGRTCPPRGHDPGSRLHEPVADGTRRRLRGLHAQLRPAGQLRLGSGAGAGFAESWAQSEDGLTWTFKMREGMLWSDGEPATVRGRPLDLQFVLDGINSEDGFIGARLSRLYVDDAGVTAVDAPDATTLVVTTDRPERPDPAHLRARSCPSTSGRTSPCDRRGRLPEHADGRRLRAIPGRRVADRPVHPLRTKNPNYWNDAGGADEVIIQIFSSADTMVQALRTGAARLRPQRQCRPVRCPGDRGGDRQPSRVARTDSPSSASTPMAPEPARRSLTAARVDRRCWTGVP